MDFNSMNEQVIKKYENDERAMILIYAQWCINNGHDPIELYERAYPGQPQKVLNDMLQLTVPKDKSDVIDDETVLNVLQLFGNDHLAFVVQQEIDQRRKE